MNRNALILILSKQVKNKRLLCLISEFIFYFSSYSVYGIPRQMEKIILKFPKFCQPLGFSHIIIFSEKKFRKFIQFFKISKGPVITFQIVKFLLKKEVSIKNIDCNLGNVPLLLLNNFQSEKKSSVIICNLINQLFPTEKINKNFLKKFSKGILFDFDEKFDKIEIRFYQINGTMPIIPRNLRNLKKKYKSKLNINYQQKLIKNESPIKKLENLSFIRMIELGPRITLKLMEILS